MAVAHYARTADERRVLTQAVAQVATCWRLTNEQLGVVLGLSPATASRLRSGGFELDRSSKAFELGQYLVRLFRSLDSLMGSDDAAAISWLRTTNIDLGRPPIELIRSFKGLNEVTNYVDDHRAQV